MIETTLMESADAALLASFLAAGIATLGLIVVVFKGDLAGRYSPYFASLAAGLLLATAILLFAEAMSINENAALFAIGGYLFLFALNNIFDPDNTTGRVLIPLFAIGFHSFIDGMEYGILFNFDVRTALMASGGLILHEFAEGVVLYVLMRKANLGALSAFVLAFIGAALTTPLGTVTALSFMDVVEPEFFGMLISVASGALLYVGTTHLIDHIRGAENRPLAMLFYLFGILIAFAMAFAHLADHGHHDQHVSEAHDADH